MSKGIEMGLKAWLIPQEKQFFDLLEKQLEIVREGTTILHDMVEDKEGKGPSHYQKMLRKVEHAGDDMVHEVYHALNQTFITPIDREDIIALTSAMDDILDHMNAATRRMIIYAVDPRKDEVIKSFSRILCDSVDELMKALKTIRHLPTGKDTEKYMRHIHRLENEGDDVHLDALGGLFNGMGLDPITVMKRKEIYDMLETGTDKCEDVANIIGDIVVKHA
jgi:predicted phosphate transport protein (TIGR00153 family)